MIHPLKKVIAHHSSRLSAQLKLPPLLLESECIANPEAYNPKPHCLIVSFSNAENLEELTIAAPMPKISTFNTVKKIFRGLLKYLPRFMKSQKTPLSPYVNQLAKSALISDSKSLKMGIASAMIQAMIHSMTMIISQ